MLRILVITVLFCISCQTGKHKFAAQPKSLILFIGDGMGPQQISSLYYLSRYGKTSPVYGEPLAFERLADRGHVAISATEPEGNIVVDSACSATQLAIGEKTFPEFIGLNIKGDSEKTILEKAKAKGKATGVVSDTRITHATPASFAAHAASRYQENEIAESLLEVQADVLFSGGARHFLSYGKKEELAPGFVVKSKRKDNRKLLDEAKEKGYSLIFSKQQMQADKSSKVLGLFSDSGMPDSIWQHANEKDDKRTVPNLKEMTQSAVERLSANPNGYFLMVEAGQIDWAAHDNDAGTMFHEMTTANQTLNFLIDWVEKHPDTLLVVTADHETGGFGFSYHLADRPQPAPISGAHFPKGLREVTVNYVPTSVVDKIYAQKFSLKELMFQFSTLPKEEQTAVRLQKMVQANIDFDFSLEAARRTLKMTKNVFASHEKDDEMLPLVEGKQAFYTNVEGGRVGLIAREIAPQQGVVWATGTHTATPVYVFTYGPKAESLNGFTHHSKVGQWMQEVLGL